LPFDTAIAGHYAPLAAAIRCRHVADMALADTGYAMLRYAPHTLLRFSHTLLGLPYACLVFTVTLISRHAAVLIDAATIKLLY